LTEEEAYNMVEEETRNMGGSIELFSPEGHECGGVPPLPHVMLGNRSQLIPPSVRDNRTKYRRWLRSAFREPRSAPPDEYTQLTLDL